MATITACIKAKNEEANLPACLESLHGFADEIVVVNDGSTDRTAIIACEAGARVVEARSRDGNINELDLIGFQAAKCDWLMRLDADERIHPELGKRLRAVAEEGRYAGVRFARKLVFFGAWVRHGGWFVSDQLRFFRADAWDRNWRWQDLHSQAPVHGEILTLPAREELATEVIAYHEVQQFIHRTLWKYAMNEAMVFHERGVRFSPRTLMLKPLTRFFGRMLIKQGFRDGWRGLILNAMISFYPFCIQAILWDLERHKRERK